MHLPEIATCSPEVDTLCNTSPSSQGGKERDSALFGLPNGTLDATHEAVDPTLGPPQYKAAMAIPSPPPPETNLVEPHILDGAERLNQTTGLYPGLMEVSEATEQPWAVGGGRIIQGLEDASVEAAILETAVSLTVSVPTREEGFVAPVSDQS